MLRARVALNAATRIVDSWPIIGGGFQDGSLCEAVLPVEGLVAAVVFRIPAPLKGPFSLRCLMRT